MAKNRQRAGEKFNKIRRGAPCKEETLTEGESYKNGESGKNFMGLTNIQVGMPRVAPWKVANLTKMANKEKMTNLAIIHPRCNKLLKGTPLLVKNLANNNLP